MLAGWCNGGQWQSDFCQQYCQRSPYAPGCQDGHNNNCSWIQPGQGLCWNYTAATHDVYGRFNGQMQARCTQPGTLTDPLCFGPQSYVCSTKTAGQPFTQGNRYGWCEATVASQCAANNYQLDICACEIPFTEAEGLGLSALGIAENRDCIDTATQPGSEQRCRASGYILNPTEPCQNICAIIQNAANYATATMNNVTVYCDANGNAMTINMPGSTDSIATWVAWMPTHAPNFSPQTVPRMSDILINLLNVINRSTSTTDLASLRSVCSTSITNDPASRTAALNAIDFRISLVTLPQATDSVDMWVGWLPSNGAQFTKTTSPSDADIGNMIIKSILASPTATQFAALRTAVVKGFPNPDIQTLVLGAINLQAAILSMPKPTDALDAWVAWLPSNAQYFTPATVPSLTDVAAAFAAAVKVATSVTTVNAAKQAATSGFKDTATASAASAECDAQIQYLISPVGMVKTTVDQLPVPTAVGTAMGGFLGVKLTPNQTSEYVSAISSVATVLSTASVLLG